MTPEDRQRDLRVQLYQACRAREYAARDLANADTKLTRVLAEIPEDQREEALRKARKLAEETVYGR